MATYSQVKKKFYEFLDFEKTVFSYTEGQRQIINKMLYELCDITKTRAFCLNEEETYYLRKEILIGDYKRTQLIIPKNYNELKLRKNLIRIKVYKALKDKLQKKYNKMSSYVPNKYIDLYITDLNFDYRIENLLYKNDIMTLKDLLSYSKKDLLKLKGMGEKTAEIIFDKIHSLNLRFLDELSLAEKSFIVAKANEKEIENSSIYWLEYLNDDQASKVIGYYKIGTIKDITDYVKSGKKISDHLIQYANLIGIDLLNQSNIKKNGNDDLLNKSLIDYDISLTIIKLLDYYGIRTIKDLIFTHFKDLNVILINNLNFIEPTINLVHQLGFVFIDETNMLNFYAKEIENMDKQKRL